ncbi:MAG: hypothetical protein EA391_05560 [Balneolaceae bacterium]|nr:MAG: hypothetical protein EA391_05560 [Balneolaceae bacterium]
MKFFKPLLIVIAVIILLGSCAVIELALQGESETDAQGEILSAPDMTDITAAEVTTDFTTMVNRTRGMRASRIRGMSSSDLAALGAPIMSVTANTVMLNSTTLETLAEISAEMTGDDGSMAAANHREISRRVVAAINRAGGDPGKDFTTEDIRGILLAIHESNFSETCGELFNMSGSSVWLSPGENLNIANMICPSATTFFVLEGTHAGQMVESSKEENRWKGVGSAVLDGESTTQRAFSGGMSGNTIAWLQIENYTDHGIYSTRSVGTELHHIEFRNIATDKHGQEFGAVMFHNSEDISVRDSHIENVASGVRFRDSSGPLVVTGNRALNSGRNFFQCDKCNGAGIRINGNVMEHTEQTGRAPLEDWINLFMSNGTSNSWIQVNNNRAKGHSESDSGSFIMLADATGSFQEAIGNIGVNPGQVGIGIAGGEDIRVENNKMFSVGWAESNVAYYSAEYSSPCGNHQFTPGTNVAHWRNANGTLNRAWSDGRCGLTNAEIRALVREDLNMGEEIWEQ